MSNFKFIDFKKLDYPDIMPMAQVLSDLLYKGTLNMWDIIVPYTEAIEKERHQNLVFDGLSVDAYVNMITVLHELNLL